MKNSIDQQEYIAYLKDKYAPTKETARQYLAEAATLDDEGNSYVSGIYLDCGEIVGFEIACNKENCNCVGSWLNGRNDGEFYTIAELQKLV